MSKNDKVREFVKQLKNNAELLLPLNNNNDCEAYTFVQNKETIYIDKLDIIIKYDSKNDLIKVFSEELIEELIKKLKKEISNWFINISKEIKSGNYDQNSLIEPLLLLEQFYSAYIIDSKTYNNLIEEVYGFLKRICQGNEEIKEQFYSGVLEFFNSSRESIKEGTVSFRDEFIVVDAKEQKKLQRAYFIADMLKHEVIDKDLLIESGEILEFSFREIDEAFARQDLLSRRELFFPLLFNEFFNNAQEILDYYFENDKNCFFKIANSKELAKYLIDGKFSKKDRNKALKYMQIDEMANFDPEFLEELLNIPNLPNINFIEKAENGKSVISIELMKKLKKEALLKILLSETVQYKSKLTSDDLVNMYGTLSFEDLELLNTKGLINSEDIIKIIKFVNVSDSEKEKIKNKLMNFYSLSRLEQILIDEKMNPKFVENFNSFTSKILNEEERGQYFNSLIEDLKKRENRDELIICLVKKGIDFGKIEGYQISLDKISDLYLSDVINEDDIYKLYSIGLVSRQVIREIFSDNDIKEQYLSSNRENISILALLRNSVDFIRDEYNQGYLTLSDLIKLYSMKDGISNNDLGSILAGVDNIDSDIASLLPDTITPEKVEFLFINYLISQDDLSQLVGRGIITQEQSIKLADKLVSHEEYERIFSGNSCALLTRESEGNGQDRTHGIRLGSSSEFEKNRFKIDPLLQTSLLDKIGFDDRRLVLQGYNNSMDGYIVYPSEELGIMLFFNPNKPGNATYIMSLQQGMFFLKRNRKNNISQIESTATKQALRETEHIKVKNASRGWGKNILDAIKQLSPRMRERLKDSNYTSSINKIIEDIMEDYDIRKIK